MSYYKNTDSLEPVQVLRLIYEPSGSIRDCQIQPLHRATPPRWVDAWDVLDEDGRCLGQLPPDELR